MGYEFFKRVFDVAISVIVIIVLSPVLLVIALIVKFSSVGPILYTPKRVGKDGKLFTLYKFRSMVHQADKSGPLNVGDNDQRVTKIGKVLRHTKIDEFPQLINVLDGDMSLVGPRPDIPKYASELQDDASLILGVKPGITDWASIVNIDQHAGLTRMDPDAYFDEVIRPVKIRLQKYYCTNRSFAMDIYILCATIIACLSRIRLLPKEVRAVIRSVEGACK